MTPRRQKLTRAAAAASTLTAAGREELRRQARLEAALNYPPPTRKALFLRRFLQREEEVDLGQIERSPSFGLSRAGMERIAWAIARESRSFRERNGHRQIGF